VDILGDAIVTGVIIVVCYSAMAWFYEMGRSDAWNVLRYSRDTGRPLDIDGSPYVVVRAQNTPVVPFVVGKVG
jgi:hypothetical protein